MDRVRDITQEIEATLKDKYPTSLRYVDIHGIQVYNPHHVLFGIQPGPNRDSNIDSNNEYRMRFPASLTTEQYLSELQNKYDVDIPLRIFLYEDSKINYY